MAQNNQNCKVPFLVALPVVAFVFGVSYDSKNKNSGPKDLAARAFPWLTKEQKEADWSLPKLCAYKYIKNFDLVLNSEDKYVQAFNNLVAKEESCDKHCMTMLAYNVLGRQWTYAQSLAVSKFSIEEATSKYFTNSELVAIYYGATFEQINANAWNEGTSFLLKLGMSVEDILIRDEASTKRIAECAFKALEETSSSNAIINQCGIADATPMSEDASYLLDNKVIFDSMSGCSVEMLFD